MDNKENKGLSISVKSFITAIVVIALLMIAAYILTLTVPAGSYVRFADSKGNLLIDTVRTIHTTAIRSHNTMNVIFQITL